MPAKKALLLGAGAAVSQSSPPKLALAIIALAAATSAMVPLTDRPGLPLARLCVDGDRHTSRLV